MIPGEIITAPGDIEINAGREAVVVPVANTGDRPIDIVEVYCVFSDTYGQMMFRPRVAIVNAKMGGLKPGETKSFRLPFDAIPDSWNQKMPQLVIAAVKFS